MVTDAGTAAPDDTISQFFAAHVAMARRRAVPVPAKRRTDSNQPGRSRAPFRTGSRQTSGPGAPLAAAAREFALPPAPLHHLLDAFEQDVRKTAMPNRALFTFCIALPIVSES